MFADVEDNVVVTVFVGLLVDNGNEVAEKEEGTVEEGREGGREFITGIVEWLAVLEIEITEEFDTLRLFDKNGTDISDNASSISEGGSELVFTDELELIPVFEAIFPLKNVLMMFNVLWDGTGIGFFREPEDVDVTELVEEVRWEGL